MAATVQTLFDAAENRISAYALTKKSPISDDRIKEIVSSAIKHTPSAFNVQSARAVILLGSDHDKLWDMGDAQVKAAMPELAYNGLKPRIAGFKGAYGSILWFEDQKALDALKAKNPGVANVVDEWSDHSSGMHQYIVWMALELEGLGANLQHYNFMPKFTEEVLETWNLPKEWKLKSQQVFGAPEGGELKRRHPRTYQEIDGERLMVFGN